MRQILFFSTIISLAVITGCGTRPDQNAVDGAAVNSPIDVNKLSPNPSPAINSSQPITAPNISTPVNVPVQTQASSNNAGLNPAHGQPGHKCEIAVGAPLNSVPSTAATTPKPANQNQVITTSTPTVTSTATTTPVKVAAGMNPSHGQPGHRCDIAVGAPLNSAPATTTTTTPSVTPTVNSNVTPGSISPSIINTTPTITTPTTTTTAASTPVKVAKGMNPSHGQPGHRCDIAVGAPLNSPSNTTTPVTTTPESKKQ